MRNFINWLVKTLDGSHMLLNHGSILIAIKQKAPLSLNRPKPKQTLRKHAYSNLLKILQSRKENVQIKKI